MPVVETSEHEESLARFVGSHVVTISDNLVLPLPKQICPPLY